MALDQGQDLALDRREVRGLDLDDLVAAQDVDDVRPDPGLQLIAGRAYASLSATCNGFSFSTPIEIKAASSP